MFLSNVEQFLLPCAYKQLFNISCPLCGTQRAILFIFRGDFSAACLQFPPLIILAILLVYLVFVQISKRKISIQTRNYCIVIFLVSLAANMVCQNILD